MAEKVLAVFEKPIYFSFEPVDPHLFAVGLGVADTPVQVDVLLRDAAVTYAVQGQQMKGVRLVGLELQEYDTQPARLVEFMAEHGARIFAVEEDLRARGIEKSDLVKGVEVVKEEETARIIAEHDSVMVL